MRERGRVRNINSEYDSLVVQLGGVVVQPGKERKRTTAAKAGKPGKPAKLRKEDILFEATNYLRALMTELETVKVSMAKDVEVRSAVNHTLLRGILIISACKLYYEVNKSYHIFHLSIFCSYLVVL